MFKDKQTEIWYSGVSNRKKNISALGQLEGAVPVFPKRQLDMYSLQC